MLGISSPTSARCRHSRMRFGASSPAISGAEHGGVPLHARVGSSSSNLSRHTAAATRSAQPCPDRGVCGMVPATGSSSVPGRLAESRRRAPDAPRLGRARDDGRGGGHVARRRRPHEQRPHGLAALRRVQRRLRPFVTRPYPPRATVHAGSSTPGRASRSRRSPSAGRLCNRARSRGSGRPERPVTVRCAMTHVQ